MSSTCLKCVCGVNYCSKCDIQLIKYGFIKTYKQRYRCKECKTTAVNNYKYNAYNKHINEKNVAFIREGVGIRSTARLLQISANHVDDCSPLFVSLSDIPFFYARSFKSTW